ncbi:hypothetical protein MVEN_02299300 [Mycena venus]|uniref:Uncharacterized protein n=1 Tax=Mycena venus TaxID=2733690 RepID=A0A8H6X5U1_9AGAR|nr:hypothetical protein MVEN_02299300 [Mycena venus]
MRRMARQTLGRTSLVSRNHPLVSLERRFSGLRRRDTHPRCSHKTGLFLPLRAQRSRNLRRPRSLNSIIRLFPLVENLFMLPARDLRTSALPIRPGFDDLPLKRLHCDLDRVFDLASTSILVTHPSLLHPTHLELIGGLDREVDSPHKALARWKTLADLPWLNHLALNIFRNDLQVWVHLLAGTKKAAWMSTDVIDRIKTGMLTTQCSQKLSAAVGSGQHRHLIKSSYVFAAKIPTVQRARGRTSLLMGNNLESSMCLVDMGRTSAVQLVSSRKTF